MRFRTFKALHNEICGRHLGVTSLVIYSQANLGGKRWLLLIIFYLANVYLVPTITRNCKNLFCYVSNTTVDLWWSHQYGRHWLHLCIADALSSPSFGTLGPLAGIEPAPCDSSAALYNQMNYRGKLLRVIATSSYMYTDSGVR